MTGHLLSATLAALVALIAVWTLRRQSASLRHALLLAALLRFAVPTGWLVEAGVWLARRLPGPAPTPRALDDFARLLLSGPAMTPPAARPHASLTFADAACLLWIAGGLAYAAIWMRRMARRVLAVREPEAPEAAALRSARERFTVAIPVGLRIAAADHGPAVRGWLRPSIVLPDRLSDELSAPELEAVIVHELAHVRRRDNLAAAAAHAIVSLFWFHPLVWWIERRMLVERERACDDLVLLNGARPEDYAAGLLKVCRQAFAGPAVYAGASGSDLKSRMERIMSTDTSRSSRCTLRAAAAFLLAVAMFPAGFGFLRAQQPDEQLRRKQMVEMLLQQGRMDEAAALAREILAADPHDIDAREFVLSLRIGKEGCTQSVTDLGALLAEAPDNTNARLDLGRALAACGDTARALTTFQEVVRLHPRLVRAWLELAKIQAAHSDFDAVLKSAAEVLKIDPANRAARLAQANAFTGKRQFDDAREVLQEILRAEPDSADAWFQMGTAYLAEQRFALAEESFQRARRLDPANSRELMGVVEVYLAQNRPEEAIALLQAEMARHPGNNELHIALGNTAVRAGQYDLALAEFQAVLGTVDAKSKTAGDLYLRIGEAARRKGDFKAAIAGLEKAREIDPQNSMAVNTLALSLESAGRMEEARRAYENVLQLDPRSGVALNNLAYLLSETGGDLDQALLYAQRAALILPNLDEIRDTLGWIYLKKGLADRAIATFSQLVSKQAAKSTFHYHLALALNQNGDRSGARRELDAALRNNPTAEETGKIEDLLRSLR